MSRDYKARIREAILPDRDHDVVQRAGPIGDGRLDGDEVSGDRALKLAAVLVPVVDYENEPKILLTRADHASNIRGEQRSAARSKPRTVVQCLLIARAQEEIGLTEYVDVAGFEYLRPDRGSEFCR